MLSNEPSSDGQGLRQAGQANVALKMVLENISGAKHLLYKIGYILTIPPKWPFFVCNG